MSKSSKVKLKLKDSGQPVFDENPTTAKAKVGLESFARFVDPSGKLNFASKAIIHAEGVDFSGGSSFRINMVEIDVKEELGRGQYGVVNRVIHRPTKAEMAMKQIRLEISESTFNHILLELDVLHKSHSKFIVDFYGAFFIESTVNICMEYMDAGSLDRLYGQGLPEPVLAKVADSVVRGLKFLKDELLVIHRVKPTNILVNKKGQIKLCDFGVSGQLIQSMAKTNIGCQSYMAPERISMGEVATYTTSSDVWSLGITLWEIAMGRYPYAAHKFDSVFAQLNAIVNGVPTDLSETFSANCRDFVRKCLTKNPKDRPTYATLLEHPFLIENEGVVIDMGAWATEASSKSVKI